jgi:hypothetical protein
LVGLAFLKPLELRFVASPCLTITDFSGAAPAFTSNVNMVLLGMSFVILV